MHLHFLSYAITKNSVKLTDLDSLDSLINKAFNNGFQVCAHAIGDRAMNDLLDVYYPIYEETSTDPRFSIIHCQFTNTDLLKRFKDKNILANVQPSFVMTDYPIVQKAVGKIRSNDSYAWNSMLSSDIHTVFSSDAPIESFNPFEGIYAAVCRKDLKGMPQNGWNTHENISLMDALKSYTLEPAYSNFEEDITSLPPEQTKDIRVLETYVDGIRRYFKK